MARELIKKIIDGDTYEYQQFNTTKSLKILTRLAKIVGEPLSIAISGLKGDRSQNVLDRQLDPNLIGTVVKSLVERLDENSVVDLIEELTARDNLLCNGKKVNFDSHYEGKLGHLLKVLTAALEVQYGNFFSDSRELVDSLIRAGTPLEKQT